jgi:hypothetical protein
MQSKSLQNFAAIPQHKQGANMANRLQNQVAIITGASRSLVWQTSLNDLVIEVQWFWIRFLAAGRLELCAY